MHVYRLEGQWHRLKGKVQQRWGTLTHDPAAQAAGNRLQLIGRIQELYGVSHDEARRQFIDWEKRLAA